MRPFFLLKNRYCDDNKLHLPTAFDEFAHYFSYYGMILRIEIIVTYHNDITKSNSYEYR